MYENTDMWIFIHTTIHMISKHIIQILIRINKATCKHTLTTHCMVLNDNKGTTCMRMLRHVSSGKGTVKKLNGSNLSIHIQYI
jgi:hypothetical protein